MKVYGVSAYDIDTVVTDVSRRRYNGNVVLRSIADCSNSRGPRATFTLRVCDSTAGGLGAIGNPRHTGSGPHGMRRNSLRACWHAHWDVIEELLRRYPDARVTSGYLARKPIVYTAATFKEAALATAHLNVGGTQPVTMPECCECDHCLYSSEPAYVLDDTPTQASHTIPARTDDSEGQSRYQRGYDVPVNAYGHGPHHEGGLSGYSYRPSGQSSPDPKHRYLLDGLPAAPVWTPRVTPGSATVADTLDEIDNALSEA